LKLPDQKDVDLVGKRSGGIDITQAFVVGWISQKEQEKLVGVTGIFKMYVTIPTERRCGKDWKRGNLINEHNKNG
jgi:hypothetical protein